MLQLDPMFGLFLIMALGTVIFCIAVKVFDLMIDLLEYFTGKSFIKTLRPWEDDD